MVLSRYVGWVVSKLANLPGGIGRMVLEAEDNDGQNNGKHRYK